jgi:hypothetical protein
VTQGITRKRTASLIRHRDAVAFSSSLRPPTASPAFGVLGSVITPTIRRLSAAPHGGALGAAACRGGGGDGGPLRSPPFLPPHRWGPHPTSPPSSPPSRDLVAPFGRDWAVGGEEGGKPLTSGARPRPVRRHHHPHGPRRPLRSGRSAPPRPAASLPTTARPPASLGPSPASGPTPLPPPPRLAALGSVPHPPLRRLACLAAATRRAFGPGPQRGGADGPPHTPSTGSSMEDQPRIPTPLGRVDISNDLWVHLASICASWSLPEAS